MHFLGLLGNYREQLARIGKYSQGVGWTTFELNYELSLAFTARGISLVNKKTT
jgi:hypothetical protein